MIKEVRLPEISENVESGEVIEVLVAVGDIIDQEQSVVELETEKATFEVPSPIKGRVTEINVKAGQKINVGEVIVKVETDIEARVPEKKPPAAEEEVTAKEPEVRQPGPVEQPLPVVKEPPIAKELEQAEVVEQKPLPAAGTVPAAPSVRQLARELGVDISQVPGSGPGGRVSLDDVKKYAKTIVTGAATRAAPAIKVRPLPDFTKWGQTERQPMTAIRKKIAENLSRTWSSIPQVTQHGEADITELMEFRNQYAKKVEEAGGKLTVTAMVIKVVASALKELPKFNASVDAVRGEIIYKKYYNIGVAVDTERGLLVPVIKDVEKKNILQLSVELTELARKTRDGKVGPENLMGGNFTVSNLGGIAGTYFTPILNWPEVAILGVGRAVKEPVFSDGLCQPRTVLPLSVSYDHRIIDGADGARFLKWIIQALEQPFLLAMEE